jgi:lysozyme
MTYYTLNEASIDLIKSFEGWRANAYRDSVGVWTIGYGHTSMAGPPKVTSNLKITKSEGEAMLQHDLQKYAKAVDDAVTVPLTPNQFGALVSFCYNVGPGNFNKSSVLRYTNAGNFKGVPARLLLWNKAGGRVLKGLTRRRKAEGKLFLKSVNHKPLAKSRTISGGSVAAAGGIGVLVEPLLEATDVLTGQQETLGGGSVLQMVIAAVIIVGAITTLYARWDDAGRPKPW